MRTFVFTEISGYLELVARHFNLPAIHTNIWKFVELIYTLGTKKLEKGNNRD